MKKTLFTVMFLSTLIFLSTPTLATEQTPESLIYKDERLWLYDEPLESYFNNQHPRPNFEKLIDGWCSGEWKGYHGVWEIKDGYLLLLKLQKPCSEEEAPDAFISILFPPDSPPIKAIWLNGAIHALYNKKMLELKFENGKLISEELKDWPTTVYGRFLRSDYWRHDEHK